MGSWGGENKPTQGASVNTPRHCSEMFLYFLRLLAARQAAKKIRKMVGIFLPSHPENASKTKSTIYLASIFYSKNGIDQGIDLLQKYAKRYNLNVLVSNYGGFSWRLEAGGMSSFITNQGLIKGRNAAAGESLLVAVKIEGDWPAQVITL